ncbi:MAG: hypothetical protein IPG08_16505 [Sphingobacteriaceae bacterium]|nr:hypothetical protein [Sphingobacteriaceae bacterium]
MRVSVQITPALKLSYIVNNFTNVEYQSRPGDMRAPTLHVVQLSIRPKYKDK